jgi:two-component system, cell cycle sensor histidine kinase and response regulator CckA
MTGLLVPGMLLVSIIFQVTAAIFALTLVRVNDRNLGWVALAAAILLMTLRRSVTFFRITTADTSFPADPTAEAIALLISALMLVGIAAIVPRLRSLKASEVALRESKEGLDQAQRAAHLGSWYLDREKDEPYWSDEVYRIFGISRAEEHVTGKDYFSFVLPDDLDAVKDAFRRSKDAGAVTDVVHRVQRPDGEVRVVRCRWEHQRDEAGGVVGSRGTVLDITDLRTAKEALSESQRMLRLVLDAIPVRVFWKNRELVYLGCNARFAEDAGLAGADEIAGKTDFDLIWSEQAELYRTIDREVMETVEDKLSFEGPQLGPDGTQQWLRMSKMPLRTVDGTVFGVLGVYEDITDRQRAEDEHRELEGQLRQHQKLEAIGRLAGGIAHDFNNLLAPILGYSELLLHDLEPDDDLRDSVDGIMRAGEDARDLVQQLLAFSRKQALEYRPTDLNRSMEGLEALLRRTIPEDIEIELAQAPNLHPVLADIGQMKQVVINLAVNAADAMPQGGRLTIETGMAYLDHEYESQLPDVDAGAYVMLVVRDTGIGMDEETREQVFDPFFSTKGELGTGLGLATVHGIVKQHGGGIRVISQPGQGTTFEIFLPVTEEEVPTADSGDATPDDLGGSETILLVEDNPHVRELTRTMIERLGYTALVAEDATMALEILESHGKEVDLLFTDVVMPGMDGGELFVRVNASYPGIKVLYMSGYIDRVIASRGVLAAGTDYLRKPFTHRAMATRIRAVLDED